MKPVAIVDPKRGENVATDLLDLWRLLADDPIATGAIVDELRGAPDQLRRWLHQQLTALFVDDPGRFVSRMAPGLGAARSVDDVRELWEEVIGPTLA